MTFAEVLAGAKFDTLPPSVKASATALYTELQAIDESARAVLQDSNEMIHNGISSVKELSKLIADCKRTSALISQIYASMDRLPSN